MTYRGQDDRHVREQAAIDREVAEAKARDIDRARLAMKEGAVVTPGLRSVGRWLVRVAVALVVVLVIGTLYVLLRPPVRWRLGLCDQGTIRCASPDRADVCVGGQPKEQTGPSSASFAAACPAASGELASTSS